VAVASHGPRPGTIVLVLLLVAVVVFFVLGGALGAGGGAFSARKAQGFLAGLLPDTPMPASDADRPVCTKGGLASFPTGEECVVTIQPGGAAPRSLTLSPRGKVRVTFEPLSEDDPVVPMGFEIDRSQDLKVPKRGAKLRIACLVPPPGSDPPRCGVAM
jgi:hypothetical protein